MGLLSQLPCEQVSASPGDAVPEIAGNDELTVTLKMRRKVVLGHHAALLEALYRDELSGSSET